MVVAESRYIAEDALADVIVDIDPIDAVVDLEAAMAPGAPLVHPHLESNAAAHVVQRKGDYASARAAADVLIKRRFLYDRGVAAAIENRAVAVDWNPRAEEMTIWDTTQAPIPIRNGLAKMLGLLESQVRVVAPFVGGGFGPKIMMFYPEELLLPWAAMRLERPLKWTEDRQENFYATTQERGQVHESEMALSKDGRILGVRDWFLCDTGAYDPYGLTIPINTQCTLLGPVRHSELRDRVHVGVHEQADRDAGAWRGPAARRVRQRAPAGPRGEGARHRSRRDSQAQPARSRSIPAQPRNHVSGLGAARVRQRQLPADAGAGRGSDWLRTVHPRGTAAPARRRPARLVSASRVTSKARASGRTKARA